MKKAYIGIDPGKSGFITVYKESIFNFYPMPTHKISTGDFTKTGKEVKKTVFHEEGIRDLILEIYKDTRGFEIFTAIEDVIGRQGWSAQNNFNFGYVAGMLKMIPYMINSKVEMVRPQKWQSVMYQGIKKIKKPSSTGKTMVNDTKAMSAKVAKMIAPEINFCKTQRAKKIDDNKTDSFLICNYLMKKHE